MSIRHQQTGSFVAVDDNGNEYTVLVITPYSRTEGTEGSGEVECSSEFKLADGRPVLRFGQGQYRIGSTTGTKLTSTDPQAP